MKITLQTACFGAPWIPRWIRVDGKVVGTFHAEYSKDFGHDLYVGHLHDRDCEFQVICLGDVKSTIEKAYTI